MNTASLESNPFALLLDAEAVLARVSASPRLATLNSRICRPLDKPVLGTDGATGTDGPTGEDGSTEATGQDD